MTAGTPGDDGAARLNPGSRPAERVGVIRSVPLLRTRLPLLLAALMVVGASATAAVAQEAVAGATAVAGTHVVEQPTTHGVLARRYVLQPATFGTGPRPLLVVLHGRYQTPQSAMTQTGLGPLARRRGFVVAFPSAVGGGWNAGTCCSDGASGRIPDVDFLDRVIADVAERTPVDRRRIFLTGFSNGGMMAYRFACERASSVTAIAVVAGGQTATPDHADALPQQCRPAHPVALLHVHGALDRVVPYAGGVVAGSASRVAPVRGASPSSPRRPAARGPARAAAARRPTSTTSAAGCR